VWRWRFIPVCKFNPLKSFLILAKLPPAGIGRFNHSGKRLDPGNDSVASVASIDSEDEVRKSASEGPAFNVSVKVVWGRTRGVVIGETVVARVRRRTAGLRQGIRGGAEGKERIGKWWRERDFIALCAKGRVVSQFGDGLSLGGNVAKLIW